MSRVHENFALNNVIVKIHDIAHQAKQWQTTSIHHLVNVGADLIMTISGKHSFRVKYDDSAPEETLFAILTKSVLFVITTKIAHESKWQSILSIEFVTLHFIKVGTIKSSETFKPITSKLIFLAPLFVAKVLSKVVSVEHDGSCHEVGEIDFGSLFKKTTIE